ncbi:DUF1269 domain-containing protein [Paenarthrobacter sp. OM7]|uniref:DUF1269 domain-containing protein n=1 Tax=Paenarthrobacter sp. AMU7 TaxID=3162492 RepID=A0AB39YQ31_9MICC|nr:DUF1269 domain-containing protein [Paenarthrobacter sp. OM7]WGM20443.1 DUF1269 domain-containing protein [Paenarthrobacter sp. OM7]
MATLSVWKFDEVDAAQQAERVLLDLQTKGLIRVHDAAVVSWPEKAKKPKTSQLNNTVGAGALGGSFWGFLFGLMFFVPLLGAAVGAATGAFSGALRDVGIDDTFIDRVREKIKPGTSALFVMTSQAVTDKVREAFTGTKGELLESNLSHVDEEALKVMFDSDEN